MSKWKTSGGNIPAFARSLYNITKLNLTNTSSSCLVSTTYEFNATWREDEND